MKLPRSDSYLLDEPTNHLDIQGQEASGAELEESATAFFDAQR